MGWFDSVEHNRWLSAQMRALLDEARAAIVPTGFAHVTSDGGADPDRPVELAVTARMTYVFSLGALMGIPGCRGVADHGVRSLIRCFGDPDNGGWFTAIRPVPGKDGHGIPWDEDGQCKSQFHISFLILAASAATVADRPDAHELLAAALHDQERHWLEECGLVTDLRSPDLAVAADRHTMDSLVHTAEAYLSAAEATTDPVWVERAEVISRFVWERARADEWRLPEYYDSQWRPTSGESEPFIDGRCVYAGHVIGHSLQWSRLALHIRAALRSMGRPQPDYLMEMARELFERARVDGWRRSDGIPGFALTVDDGGEVLVAERRQWVVCEGVCTATSLRRGLLDDGVEVGEVEHFEHCYRSWIDHINDDFIERPGRWYRVLDAQNHPIRPAAPIRSDIYHAIQAMLMPRVPLWPPFASAISRGLLDHPEQPAADRRSWTFFHRR